MDLHFKNMCYVSMRDLSTLINMYYNGFAEYSRFSLGDVEKVVIEEYTLEKEIGCVAYIGTMPVGFTSAHKVFGRQLTSLGHFFSLQKVVCSSPVQNLFAEYSEDNSVLRYQLCLKDEGELNGGVRITPRGNVAALLLNKRVDFSTAGEMRWEYNMFHSELRSFFGSFVVPSDGDFTRKQVELPLDVLLDFSSGANGNIPYVTSADYMMSFVVVDRKYQRQGVARALKEQLELKLVAAGVPQLFSITIDDGCAGAYFLNQKQGYETLLKIPDWYANGAGMALMGKRL